MFWNVFRMEMAKIFERKVFWIELSLLALVFILLNAFGYLDLALAKETQDMPVYTWPGALEMVLGIVINMGGILMIVLVGLVAAQEYSWRTMQLWLSHGVSRKLLIGVKALTLLIPVICTILAAVLLGGSLSALLSWLVQGTADVQSVDFGQLIFWCVTTAYTLLPYLALTFLVAIVSRSALVAVSLGLIYILVVEPLLHAIASVVKGTFAQVVLYLPASLGQVLLTPFFSPVDNVGSTATSATLVSPALAAGCIGLYTLLLCVIAFWSFSRQNMTN